MLDYEKLKKEKIKENMHDVIKNYKNKDFQLKIKRYSEKYNIKIGDIEKRILDEDKITISFFSKDPSKQNFYENIAANYIKKIKNVYNFKNLPNSGAKAIYLIEDKIYNTKEIKKLNRKLPSKSIDFMWEIIKNDKNIKAYAYHKYIKDDGGAQDNQFNDVIYSINAASNKNSKSKHIIFFICDGKHFNASRIKKLKSLIKNKNYFVLNINQLEQKILNL